MQYLGREIWKHGGSLLQAEDEIAGIAAAVGASFAGVKAMTATSGPGLSLKTEVLGLASVAELPLVCVDVQRGGPSTGMPTKPRAGGSVRRGLLRARRHRPARCWRPSASRTRSASPSRRSTSRSITRRRSSSSRTRRSPSARRSWIRSTPRGFQLVERLAADGAGTGALRPVPVHRVRHQPPQPSRHEGRQLPGRRHRAQRTGRADGQRRDARPDERQAAEEDWTRCKHRRDLFVVEGDPDATVGLISWGSVAGVALEALQLAQAEGLKVKLLVPKLLYPVAEEIYREFFASLRKCLVIEQSHQGQLYRLIRMWVPVPPEFQALAKSGSNPITPEEVLDEIRRAWREPLQPSVRNRRPAMSTECPLSPEVFTTKDYRSSLKPIWCPGCGDFGVVTAIYRALAAIGRPPHEIAFISGIGCSSRIPGYTTAYGFNTVHGRALPIAQGIKMANPESAGAGRRRRRRRLLDRRRPRAACHPPQSRPDLHRHGQPDLRPDQGPVVPHLPARQEDRLLDLRQHGGSGESAALRAGLRRRLRGPGRARPTWRAWRR